VFRDILHTRLAGTTIRIYERPQVALGVQGVHEDWGRWELIWIAHLGIEKNYTQAL
jgi:hypothetical protein